MAEVAKGGNSEPGLSEFWTGRLEGTNQAFIVARIKVLDDRSVSGRALIYDYATGAFTVRVSGRIDGSALNLSLSDFKTRAAGVVLPISGEMSLSVAGNEATGTWNTIVGTQGTCHLTHATIPVKAWRRTLRLAWLNYTRQVIIRLFPWAYVIGLFVLLIESGTHKFDLSYPEMTIALAPAPFIFKEQIADLIRTWRISEIGPLKVQAPIPENREAVQAGEAWFSRLDSQFVANTKRMLMWLAQYGTVSRASFDTFAGVIGVPAENIQTTWDALVASGCASSDGTNLVISPIGRAYATRLLHRAPA